MQDLPRPHELVAAVATFLREEVASTVDGAAAFQLRVAINALDLVARQLTHSDGEKLEQARLENLLNTSGSLDALNRLLSERITAGTIDLDTPGLREHLWTTTMAKLAVDQPTYATYRRALDTENHRDAP